MLGIPPGHDRGCSCAREWVSLRLDGELSEFERLFLRRHLARCHECQAYAVAAGAVTRAIRETPYEAPARSLRPYPVSSRHAFSRPAFASFRVRTAAIVVLVLVAAVAGVAVGTLIGPSGGSPVPSNSGPSVIADLQPEDVPVRPRPVGRTANV